MKARYVEVVKGWAGLQESPKRSRRLKTLWTSSDHPSASNWDEGAGLLEEHLKPHLRTGQVMDRATIQALKPNTVANLVDSLRMSSGRIVKAWAKLKELPNDGDDLKGLWGASKDPLAADWNAGAAKLADDLHPDLRPGQVVNQATILALNPSTYGELSARLGW
jgi:hypothetical protein